VFHGDTIYGETTVLEQSDPAGDTALQTVVLETKGTNQHGAMAFSFVRKFLLEAS
jgi:acyl dehydratase